LLRRDPLLRVRALAAHHHCPRPRDLQRASPSLQLQVNRTFMRILIDRLERRESRLALDLSQVA
jgi:hypothetical protein